MLTYILILIISTPQGITSQQIPFTSHYQCEAQAEKFNAAGYQATCISQLVQEPDTLFEVQP